jgi:hypothetical protein
MAIALVTTKEGSFQQASSTGTAGLQWCKTAQLWEFTRSHLAVLVVVKLLHDHLLAQQPNNNAN